MNNTHTVQDILRNTLAVADATDRYRAQMVREQAQANEHAYKRVGLTAAFWESLFLKPNPSP